MRDLQDQTAFWKWMTAIIRVYLLLGAVYVAVTPPFEASDEYKHYPVVHHIQNGNGLVVLDPDNAGKWRQDGAQPPLYYLLMAGLTAGVDTSDLEAVHVFNDHAFIGDPNQVLNKNLMIPTPHYDQFPGVGSTRAVYMIRIASLLLGVGTVVCAGLLGRTLFGAQVGLLAAPLTGFNPMFLFTSAAVNNDSLANLLGAAGLYGLVRLWQREGKVGFWRLVMLGVVLGLGMLTKLSLGALLGLTGVAMAVLAWRQRRWRLLFVDGVLVAGIAFGLAAPLFWFNWVNYGDITALNVFIEVQGVRDSPLTWAQFYGEIGAFYRSFWGLFGGVNIAMPEVVYNCLNVLAIVGFVGFLWRGLRVRGAWLVLVWPLILFGLLIRWTLTYSAFQGRLIFPGLAGVSVVIACGVVGMLESKKLKSTKLKSKKLRGGLVAGLGMLAGLVGVFVIRPVYVEPAKLYEVPAEAAFGPIVFGEAVSLVGVAVRPGQETEPGANVPLDVTLYWRSGQQTADDYLTSVHLLGRDLQSVAQVNRHPAWGMVPTSRWRPGDIWRDQYRLFVDEDALAPNRLWVKVAVYDPENDVELTARDTAGNEIGLVTVGDGVLRGNGSAVPETVLDAHFEGVTLVGYEMPTTVKAGDQLPITLTWGSDDILYRDMTVFVQLLGENGVLASGDSPPLATEKVADNFPTALWRPGDVVVGRYVIDVPADVAAGQYRIAVGMYDGAYRLPLLAGGDAVVWGIGVTR